MGEERVVFWVNRPFLEMKRREQWETERMVWAEASRLQLGEVSWFSLYVLLYFKYVFTIFL
jgi:hypothetical protein